MPGKALTGRLSERLEEEEVMLRGDDRDVAHVGSQGGELGLYHDSVAVPAQECLVCG